MECDSKFSPTTSKSDLQPSFMVYGSDRNLSEVIVDVDIMHRGPQRLSRDRRTVLVYEKQRDDSYISDVAKRYIERKRRMELLAENSASCSKPSSLPMIKKRLRDLIGECDLERISCCVPMCGRVFDTIEVLAWHMSYSHHDLATKSAYGNLCFVCGIRMDNAKASTPGGKGKTIHLTSKHKDLCSSHNEQCIYQRLPVISPLAPAAMRILQPAEDEYIDVEDEPYAHSAYGNDDEESTSMNSGNENDGRSEANA